MDEQSLPRNAISVNNIGASLLAKGCYHQAVVALKDALFLMRQATSPSGERVDASHRVAKAARSLSSPRVCSGLSCGVHLISDSCDELPTVLSLSTSKRSPSVDSLLVFRIESGDASDGVPSTDIDQLCMSSIVIYNLAIAYFCLSEVRRRCPKLRKEALRLLGVARSTLSVCDDEELEIKVVMIGLVVMSVITELLYDFGCVPQALAYAGALGHLQMIAEEYVHVYNSMCPSIKHAPAA